MLPVRRERKGRWQSHSRSLDRLRGNEVGFKVPSVNFGAHILHGTAPAETRIRPERLLPIGVQRRSRCQSDGFGRVIDPNPILITLSRKGSPLIHS